MIIYIALHPSPAPPVCARLFVLIYFIFCLDSFYLSLPFFSPLISSFSCAVALLRFVASLRRFVSRRFASRRSARAPFSLRRVFPSRRARLRCFVVTSVSIARRSNWGGARPRFDLISASTRPRAASVLGWRSAHGFVPASGGLGSAFRTLGLRPYTVALSW